MSDFFLLYLEIGGIKLESITQKFNIFDLFSMLIPGVIINTLFMVSLSCVYYDEWKALGSEKYVLFILISYLLGVVFQEIGTILDNNFFLS